jgi:hypothetical protein
MARSGHVQIFGTHSRGNSRMGGTLSAACSLLLKKVIKRSAARLNLRQLRHPSRGCGTQIPQQRGGFRRMRGDALISQKRVLWTLINLSRPALGRINRVHSEFSCVGMGAESGIGLLPKRSLPLPPSCMDRTGSGKLTWA